MVASWAVIEIVRYLFYAAKLVSDNPEAMPYPLFWLRYSLFMVLYPSGISGEVLQIITAFGAPDATPVRGSLLLHQLSHLSVYQCRREFEFITPLK